MNRVILIFLVAIFAIALVGCSTNPDTPPRFRVRNDRTTDASLQVKTSGGNTININNVKPNTTSEYQEVATGLVEITATIQGQTGSFTASFIAGVNSSYTVVVANTTPASVSIISP